MRFVALACAAALSVISAVGAQTQPLEVSIDPKRPLIESSALGQALNFDLRIVNSSDQALELRSITVSSFDEAGALTSVIEINDNGIAPGIDAVGTRSLAAQARATLFNPFHTFPADERLGRLDYRLVYATREGKPVEAQASVTPHTYRTRARLRLPLDGRVLVWDGHDYYAHHRRLDLDHPVIQQLKITANAGRYSYDFVIVDREGRRYRGDGRDNSDHYTYGAPVLAPADGVIAAVRADATEGLEEFPMEDVLKDGMNLFGNFVVIDHGGGEFSRLGHLKPGSVRVRVGQRVRTGEPLGEAGSSGSSLFPHLHYELASGADINSEGLPVVFSGLQRLRGEQRTPYPFAPASGDLIVDRRAKLRS